MPKAHIWVRSEQRPHEARVGLSYAGAAALLGAGYRVTVEESSVRAIGLQGYIDAGVEIAAEHSWPSAPDDAIIFGLKELPDDDTPLRHKHIMFGHAYKGQVAGQELLKRFMAGGGTLFDLEYLVDDTGRRVAAFGYWAGFAGAAVTCKAWVAQKTGGICGPVSTYANKDAMLADLKQSMAGHHPTALVIGALGRVGTGASDLCQVLGIPVTKWDIAETASGGPFPQVLEHDLFFNCILAQAGVPQFVPLSAKSAKRALTVIGDIACDPGSTYNPVPIYNSATDWDAPVVRVHDDPVLDVMAIDNLPSLLPVESSIDFAEQLLPSLLTLAEKGPSVWSRAEDVFQDHVGRV